MTNAEIRTVNCTTLGDLVLRPLIRNGFGESPTKMFFIKYSAEFNPVYSYQD